MATSWRRSGDRTRDACSSPAALEHLLRCKRRRCHVGACHRARRIRRMPPFDIPDVGRIAVLGGPHHEGFSIFQFGGGERLRPYIVNDRSSTAASLEPSSYAGEVTGATCSTATSTIASTARIETAAVLVEASPGFERRAIPMHFRRALEPVALAQDRGRRR